MPTQKEATRIIYTAKSQFWVGNTFFKPIDMGGRAIAEGDPILGTHAARFEPYRPDTREYSGQVRDATKSTVIAQLEAATAAPGEARAHTHPHE